MRVDVRVNPEEIVPGDIIFVSSGMRVPAHSRE